MRKFYLADPQRLTDWTPLVAVAADPFAQSVHVIFQSPPVTIRVLKYIAQIKDSQNDVIMDQVELPQVSLKNRWPYKGGSAIH